MLTLQLYEAWCTHIEGDHMLDALYSRGTGHRPVEAQTRWGGEKEDTSCASREKLTRLKVLLLVEANQCLLRYQTYVDGLSTHWLVMHLLVTKQHPLFCYQSMVDSM
jgi:hypothetical protein